MGDHAAVDIAQECHTQLLRNFGAMKDEEVLCYRRPLPCPKSCFYEGIMIDDHLGLQLLKRERRAVQHRPARDTEVFANAQDAYHSVHLEPHEGKKIRRSCNFKAWGVEVEGIVGLAGPVRSRLFSLMRLSAEASQPGPIEEKVCQGITGLWAFCAQFRRPMFSFLHALYQQKAPEGSSVFRLDRKARNELLTLACLGPCCLTDLRAVPDEHVYCVDASPSAAGVCQAWVGRNVSRELWRRSDKQGYRAPLLSKLGSYLKGTGWDEDQVEEFLDSDKDEESDSLESNSLGALVPAYPQEAVQSPACRRKRQNVAVSLPVAEKGSSVVQTGVSLGLVPRDLGEGPYDFCEVYAGCAQMSEAWRKRGFRVLRPIEKASGLDMLDERVFHGLLQLCAAGMVKFLWWAPPHAAFSPAKNPKIRNRRFPWGIHLFERETLVGNFHVLQCFLLAWVQLCSGWWFAGEQPGHGFMRITNVWVWFVKQGLFETWFDWCRFGRPFRNRTCLLHNFFGLKKLGKTCNHSVKHGLLKSQSSTQAGEYSEKFCDCVAHACYQDWIWDNKPPFSGVGGESPLGPAEVECHEHESCESCRKDDEDNLVNKTWVFRGPPGLPPPCLNGTCGDFSMRHDHALCNHPKRSLKVRSHLWAVQLSESLSWRTWIQYRFRHVQHINLQEGKARRTLFKRLPMSKRVCVFQDSKVSIGSLGRGRSPSSALNGILRSEAPYILGKNLYPGSVHLPTWSIRADDPSRFVAVREPRGIVPPWFFALQRGVHPQDLQYELVQSSSRALNRWYLFCSYVLQLASCVERTWLEASRPGPSAPSSRVRDRPHQGAPATAAGRLGTLAESGTSRMGARRPGAEFSQSLERMVGRIHQLALQSRQESKRCGRDLEQLGAAVWLASSSASPALELNSDLGKFRAGETPSPSTFQSSPSYVSSMHCLGLAKNGNDFGSRLLCAVEAHRSLVLETQRCGHAFRKPRGCHHLHSDPLPQDAVPRRHVPACARGPPRCNWFCEYLPSWDPEMAAYLGGLLRSFSEPL